MNHVNTQAMQSCVGAVQTDPAQAKKQKQISGSWVFEEGKPQFVSTLQYAQRERCAGCRTTACCGWLGNQP